MPPSTVPNPSSQDEQVLYTQPTKLGDNIILQPPISRLFGPGIVVFLPSHDRIGLDPVPAKPGNAEPQIKWAEEGYAVVAVTNYEGLLAEDALKQALDALQAHEKVNVKDKYAVVVYEPNLVRSLSDAASKESRVACFIGYGLFAAPSLSTTPIILHLTSNAPRPADGTSANTTVYTYMTTSAFFALPSSARYNASLAGEAHGRDLDFIRKWIGGPV